MWVSIKEKLNDLWEAFVRFLEDHDLVSRIEESEENKRNYVDTELYSGRNKY